MNCLVRFASLGTVAICYNEEQSSFVITSYSIHYTKLYEQTLCLVGESGSGKSVTALSIMRLIDYAGGMVLEGKIEFQGQDLAKMDQNNLRQIRGNKIAMIFQDPMSALNPVFTIGDQIAESLRLHRGSYNFV